MTTPLEQLKAILPNTYTDEDGTVYGVELLPDLTDGEIERFRADLPGQHIPPEVAELLRYCGGLIFGGLDISFVGVGGFGLEEYFPNCLPLAGDGFGNFWIVDIASDGRWQAIYYVCHDPAVIVKHSENLRQFIYHLDEFGRLGRQSHLDIIHDKTVFEVYDRSPNVFALEQRQHSLPPEFFAQSSGSVVVDLSDQPIGSGFNWGRYNRDSRIIRVGNDPLWVVVKAHRGTWLRRLISWISR